MGTSNEKLKSPYYCICAGLTAAFFFLQSGCPAKAVPTALELMQSRIARDELFNRLKAKYTFEYVVIMVPAGTIPGINVPVPVSHVRYNSTVFFAFNKSVLEGNAESAIQDFANTVIKDNAFRSILVVGHTDAKGSDAYNIDLSMNRATAVAGRLSSAGVRDNFIHRLPMGKQQPVSTNSTEPGRSRNRRVEFFISDVPEATKIAVSLIKINPCFRVDFQQPPGQAITKCPNEEVSVPVYTGPSGSASPDYIQLSRDTITVAPEARDRIPMETVERPSLKDFMPNINCKVDCDAK